MRELSDHWPSFPDPVYSYSSGGDGKILRWDLNGNTKSYRTLINNNFINRSLAISPNGRWLACGTTTSGIQLFNLNTSKQSARNSCRDIKAGWRHLALHPTARDCILQVPIKASFTGI